MATIIQKHYDPLPIISWTRACNRTSETKEFITIGPSPAGADCMQIGEENFMHFNIIECNALRNQLIRLHGEPPEGLEFFICKNEHHDFGHYCELACFYKLDPEGEITTDSEEYALKCEMLPDDWDEQAIAELRELNYPRFVPVGPAKVVKHVGKVVNIKDKTA